MRASANVDGKGKYDNGAVHLNKKIIDDLYKDDQGSLYKALFEFCKIIIQGTNMQEKKC